MACCAEWDKRSSSSQSRGKGIYIPFNFLFLKRTSLTYLDNILQTSPRHSSANGIGRQGVLLLLLAGVFLCGLLSDGIAPLPSPLLFSLPSHLSFKKIFQEWYQLMAKVSVMCSHCMDVGQTPYLFSLKECQASASLAGKSFLNCQQQGNATGPCPVRLDTIAPDLAMVTITPPLFTTPHTHAHSLTLTTIRCIWRLVRSIHRS